MMFLERGQMCAKMHSLYPAPCLRTTRIKKVTVPPTQLKDNTSAKTGGGKVDGKYATLNTKCVQRNCVMLPVQQQRGVKKFDTFS